MLYNTILMIVLHDGFIMMFWCNRYDTNNMKTIHNNRYICYRNRNLYSSEFMHQIDNCMYVYAHSLLYESYSKTFLVDSNLKNSIVQLKNSLIPFAVLKNPSMKQFRFFGPSVEHYSERVGACVLTIVYLCSE